MNSAQTCNLARLLTHTARLFPDRTALIQGEQRWTWAQLDQRVDALVAALHGLGVRQGDRLLLQSRNNLATFESAWAAFRMGCVWVPTNFRLAPGEVASRKKFISDTRKFLGEIKQALLSTKASGRGCWTLATGCALPVKPWPAPRRSSALMLGSSP